MRVEVSYKFILGFILVVGATVFVGFIVPRLGIPAEWQQLFSVSCALLVGLLLGWAFGRTFTANIRYLTGATERLSHGDLSQDLRLKPSPFPDETVDLADALNQVVAGLRELVGYVRASSEKVSQAAQGLSATSEEMTASAHEVASTVEQISLGAETQAEMVETSSQVVKEMAFHIEQSAASSQELAASASETVGNAESGRDVARSAMEQMKQLLAIAEENGAKMMAFGQQLNKIGKIVEVITGIAGKTNLLALNATIEAARAGDAGRGFAVVAEEISKLADSSGASAAEIARLIETIQQEGDKIQASMREGIAQMGAGKAAIDTTSGVFDQIIATALTTQAKARRIVELSQQEASGAQSMVEAIEGISRVIEDNAAATQEVSATTQEQSAAMEEMAQAAQDLATLAEDLQGKVRRFQLGNERG